MGSCIWRTTKLSEEPAKSSDRRGKSGGQVRDEYRDEYDPGRGGYGRAIDAERLKEEEEYGKGR